MISIAFPLKKLRRSSKYLLLGTVLLAVLLTVHHEMTAVKVRSDGSGMNSDVDSSTWRKAFFKERIRRYHQHDSVEDSTAWSFNYTLKTWKPEYVGQANLHVFEDWCGGTTAGLSKNIHYPLYPHSRTTVQKLAVSPQWTNYGLRIFGYLHPFSDGDYVFAVSSDDNSDFWLSTDESPLNVRLLAWVGKSGTEWTAPGEYEKYASQTSKPVWLSAQKRYFFEVIHKQDEKGTDHVEVAWKLQDHGFRFRVIESTHISLYVNESALTLGEVAHIPQTAASHRYTPIKEHGTVADMLREDPRDTIYQMTLMNSKYLHGVLPDCTYKPSYVMKNHPLQRYQGVQLIHLSYIYPNDYTRLTHMETQTSCFYPAGPNWGSRYLRYMRMDHPDAQEKESEGRDFSFQRRKSVLNKEDEFDYEAYQREKETVMHKSLFPDYGDDYDDYANKRRRRLFSLVKETNNMLKNTSDTRLHTKKLQRRRAVPLPQSKSQSKKPVEPLWSGPTEASKHQLDLQQNQTNTETQVKKGEPIKPDAKLRRGKRKKLKSVGSAVKPGHPAMPLDKEQPKANEQPAVPSEQLNAKQHHIQRSRKMNQTQIQRLKDSKLQLLERDAPLPEKLTVAKQQGFKTRDRHLNTTNKDRPILKLNQGDTDDRKHFRDKEIEINMPLQQDRENGKMMEIGQRDRKQSDTKGQEDQAWDKVQNGDLRKRDVKEGEHVFVREEEEDYVDPKDEELSVPPVFDSVINWNQTFDVSHLDLQLHRSDWIDLQCNISGNLLLQSSETLPIINNFMDKLNQKHNGRFTLVRVLHVVKRVDGVRGGRYLLELEVKDEVNDQLLRLTHYIYTLLRYSKNSNTDFNYQESQPHLLLCNPVGFQWNPAATVHIIVPVKNQARWVRLLISEMERVFSATQDTNFNLIVTDFSSTDMDVEKALQKSSLPMYRYVRLKGSFQRAFGLQAGVDLIKDKHSIVFLSDLHITFPTFIIDTIRKHTVEGYMAFAPVVMRLDCGATPFDAKGYWEVNGLGMLGIYKSDLDAVGGLNTREYKNRWGGEDWELIDRIFQAGLELDRVYLRNFYHHYHSKRGMWNHQIPDRHR
ncbi:beta-1,4-N-acetylgalactosaminyltransferase 3 isoform X2 [Larimichthys crocea]|uniref:beta-1,4-N-acetylgalactosaminyltransferase 3 isoform X2 n=1 Tax=Larimichthys crocea TaxID=215358 RepID=UPI000F5EFB20|nr:beta-1,4-N-acetylgalactosaminyltransferase 3 isoform X2 [Larimichthys crocea]